MLFANGHVFPPRNVCKARIIDIINGTRLCRTKKVFGTLKESNKFDCVYTCIELMNVTNAKPTFNTTRQLLQFKQFRNFKFTITFQIIWNFIVDSDDFSTDNENTRFKLKFSPAITRFLNTSPVTSPLINLTRQLNGFVKTCRRYISRTRFCSRECGVKCRKNFHFVSVC